MWELKMWAFFRKLFFKTWDNIVPYNQAAWWETRKPLFAKCCPSGRWLLWKVCCEDYYSNCGTDALRSFTPVNLLKRSLHDTGEKDERKKAERFSFYMFSVYFVPQPLSTCIPPGTVCILFILYEIHSTILTQLHLWPQKCNCCSVTSLNGLNWRPQTQHLRIKYVVWLQAFSEPYCSSTPARLF